MNSKAVLQGPEMTANGVRQSSPVYLPGINSIAWRHVPKTKVVNTVGGRVVQAFGIAISNVVVKGTYGSYGLADPGPNVKKVDPRVAQQQMNAQVQRWMLAQRGTLKPSHGLAFRTGAPLTFICESSEKDLVRNWNLNVYILGFSEQGTAVSMAPNNFNPGYVFTFFIYQDNGTLTPEKNAILSSYVNRLSQTFGWFPNDFNGPGGSTFYPQLVKP